MAQKTITTVPKLRDSLISQLKSMNSDSATFLDLVEDYISFYKIKNELIADIHERGVSIEWANSATQKGRKKNDSVSELVKVNAQMLKILQQLHIETLEGDDDSDDDFD